MHNDLLVNIALVLGLGMFAQWVAWRLKQPSIIERANFYGAYGRYIRIRHNSQYKTAYAHLSKFARSIKRNIKVKQGQVIGYVGTSGRSTGPHLHYEVIFNKKQINPLKLKMPELNTLNKSEMSDFNIQKKNINKILNNIRK